MSDTLAAITWLDNAYRTRDSDVGTLVIIAIGFSTMFLTSKILFVLVEKILSKRPLLWSGNILSLLVAAAFWVIPSEIISGVVATLAGRKTGYLLTLSDLPRLLLGSLWVPFLINPCSLLGLLMLVTYLLRPTFPRSMLILGILITIAACCAFELYYNHNPEFARS